MRYSAGESGQLIKIATYERASVEAGFDFPAWDPVSRTGGVFPLIVRKTLVLNADINADGKGFRGAVSAGNYTGDCSNGNPDFQKGFYYESARDTAGGKGESIETSGYALTRGKNHLGSGGGGGNGKFSGGGGGSNKGRGGRGGLESSSCPIPGNEGGIFGISLGTFYNNNPLNSYYNRIFMGGGGGTGTQDTVNDRRATKGGNGGGIIIIIADTLAGNGKTISANGESVDDLATAGAGGGGGGGVIILNVENYTGNLNVQVRGGNGGNTQTMPDTTGPGGGGGGGMIWYRGSALPLNISADTLYGYSGKVASTPDKYYGSSVGGAGSTQPDLIIPIRGFILNTIPDDQTICENERPEKLNAPAPMGGSGDFYYKWQQSYDASAWSDASGPGAINQKTYQPPVLTSPVYYRRIVTDQTNPALADTSFYVRINVEPALNNNLIVSDDTVCSGSSPGTLSAPMGMSGGLGVYNYSWIRSEGDIAWSGAPGTANQPVYAAPALTDTTIYRRIVTSGVCVDTSNTVTITVLASLTGNIIASDQVLCNMQSPASLTGPVPGGGDPADKRYFWEIDTLGLWAPAGHTSRDLTGIGPLAPGSRNYRRIVYSGSDDACLSISNTVNIEILPDIDGNSILVEDTTICSGLPSLDIDGSTPSGGDSPSYKYVWQTRPEGSSTWLPAPGQTSNQPFLPGSLTTTTWVRRTVFSGTGDVCMSISDSVKITTLPSIQGNSITEGQTICAGTMPDDLNGSIPSGGGEGPGSYSWQWQRKLSGEIQFTDIAIAGDEQNYSFSQALIDTAIFRRIVLSGPSTYFTCRDTSNEILISVPPAITGNLIPGETERATCVGTKPGLLDAAGNPAGGDGNYSYQWEESDDGISWIDAVGINSGADYQPGILNNPVHYRRIISSASVCSDTTIAIRIDTLTRPVLTLLSANRDSICHLEKNFSLHVAFSEGTPDYTAWYSDGTDGSLKFNELGHDARIPVTSFPQERVSYDYTIDSLIDANGCYARESNLLEFSTHCELFPDALPDILMDDSTAVCGSALSIEADPDIGNEYFWTVSNPAVTLDDSGSTHTLAGVSGNFNRQEAYLKFYATSPGCKNIQGYKPSSDSVKIVFFQQPEPVELNDSSTVLYISDRYFIKYKKPNAGEIQWSVLEGGGQFSGITSDSTLIYDIPADRNVFRLTVSNGNCTSESADILIDRRNVNVYDGISPGNPDGLNDFLVAEGLDTDGVTFNFQVFSTSGLLVREITEKDIDLRGFRRGLPNNGLEIWDGKGSMGDKVVPPGVYYYILIIKFRGNTYSPAKDYVVVK